MSNYNSMKEEFIEAFKQYRITENDKKFKRIYDRYLNNCFLIQNYVRGNLDTFKKVSCLMAAIIQRPIIENLEENDKIALDIGLTLIQKPVWYKGINLDEPFKLDEMSLEELKKDADFWDIYYKGFLDSIKYSRQKFGKKNIDLITMAQLLQTTYDTAIEIEKTNQIKGKFKYKK